MREDKEMLARHTGDFHWESVPVLAYKEDGGRFKDVTRQVLFDGAEGLACQLRYFEVSAGGHSSLEHHDHVHCVMILRGEGDVLIGDAVHHVSERDVLTIPSHHWHQFRATADAPLGFLCLVASERDRPSLPTSDDIEALKGSPVVGNFIRW
jgi:quercetin dioxygenase-like cupin family protein